MKLRRSAALTVLALAAGSTSAVATSLPASAAPTTCQGKAVTIVASTTVTRGTEGEDVVAMEPGGWRMFDALGGNDTICLAAAAGISNDRDPMPPSGWLDAGPGDDVVVNLMPTGTTGVATTVVLGLGNDSFQGADVGEKVFAEKDVADFSDPDLVDPELIGQQRDVVTNASTVFSSAPHDGPNTDRISLGAQGARVVMEGPLAPAGLLDVSAADSPVLEVRSPRRLGPPPGGDVVVDNRSRTIAAGLPVITWSGEFSAFLFGTPRRVTEQPAVSFTGTDADESVTFADIPVGDVAMGGGADALDVQSWNNPFVPRSADGGGGRDSASIDSTCRNLEVRLDVSAACDGRSGSFTSFRDVTLDGSWSPGGAVTLVGTPRSERLLASGHAVVVRAGAGHDEIMVDDSWSARVRAGAGRDRAAVSGDDVVLLGQGGRDRLRLLGSAGFEQPSGARHQNLARGGPGNDVLLGSPYDPPDRLVGGPGKDRADGHRGRHDRCYAEVTRRCGRP